MPSSRKQSRPAPQEPSTAIAAAPSPRDSYASPLSMAMARRIFLVLASVFGLGYAFIVPPLQAPDEVAHFFRAYNVSQAVCIAPIASPIPKSVKAFAAAFPPHLEKEGKVDASEIGRFFRVPLADSIREPSWNIAANLYSCVPYIPSALGVGAGRIFRLPAPALLYLARITNLAVYLGVTGVALASLGGCGIPLLLIALMPMTLSQAASASWDGVAFSTAFLWCAYIAKLGGDSKIAVLEARHYWILAGMALAASQCKADVYLMPLLIFVPASKFLGRRRKWLAISGLAGLSLAAIAIWSCLNHANALFWMERIQDRHIDFPANAAFITGHPALFAQTLCRTLRDNAFEYMTEFVGKLGWLAVRLPAWVTIMYCIVAVLSGLLEGARVNLKYVHRLTILAIVVIAGLSIFCGMWCAETPAEYKSIVFQGAGDIPGVQGRYFIPFAFPLLTALSNQRFRMSRMRLLALASLAAVIVNAIALSEVGKIYFRR